MANKRFLKNPTSISFVAPVELLAHLRQWAKDDRRSVSNLLRYLIVQEAERRRLAAEAEDPPASP
jgi:hypothetical protein